ncbi:MAG TPA: hypothetical protein VMU15_02940 [Anaeromyxobacter sp.]|nr:hypothetical protein [Anaeromyxobacter sp.]
MNAAVLAAVLLPLSWGSPSQGTTREAAEVTGRILAGGAPAPSVGLAVELWNAERVVAASQVAPDGTYRLRAPPGEYSMSVWALGSEVHRRSVTLGRACARLDVSLPGMGFGGGVSAEPARS